MGLPAPQFDLRTAAGQARHYAEIRRRLFSGRSVAALRPVRPAAPVVTETPAQVHYAPLNMLAPCSWLFLLKLASVRNEIPEEAILSPGRSYPVVQARYDAMALVYRHTQASMPGVGRLFGRDHTTVVHALHKTGSTDKLVEILPHVDAARRTKRSKGNAVIAHNVALADYRPEPKCDWGLGA